MRLDLRVDDAQVALGPFEGACRVPGGENLRHEDGAEPPRPLGGEERSGPGLADVCHQVAGEDGEPPVVEGVGRVALQDPRHLGRLPAPAPISSTTVSSRSASRRALRVPYGSGAGVAGPVAASRCRTRPWVSPLLARSASRPRR